MFSRKKFLQNLIKLHFFCYYLDLLHLFAIIFWSRRVYNLFLFQIRYIDSY